MIHSIELIDFLAHHDTKLEFNNDATVFVGQNGAGKSSIIDAITFSLFGTHMRKNNKSLIRRGANKALVKVEFSANGKKYRTVRQIDAKGTLTAQFLEKNQEEFVPIAEGERKQFGESMTKEVEKVLGMNFEKLKIASIVQQGELNSIIKAKPKEFKELLNTIIGIDRLDVAAESMKEVVKGFRNHIQEKFGYDDTQIIRIENKITECNNESKNAEPRLEKLTLERENNEEWILKLEKQIQDDSTKESQLKDLELRKKELQEHVIEVIKSIKEEVVGKEEIVNECKPCFTLSGNRKRFEFEITNVEKKLSVIESELRKLGTNQVRLEEQEEIAKKIVLKDGKCPVCDNPAKKLNSSFQKKHITMEIETIEKKVEGLESDRKLLDKKLEKLSDDLEESKKAETILKTHKIKNELQLEEIATEIKIKTKQIQKNDDIENQVKTIEKKVEELESDRKLLDKKLEKLSDDLEESKKAETILKTHKIKNELQLEEIATEIKIKTKQIQKIALTVNSEQFAEVATLDSHAKTLYDSIISLEKSTSGFNQEEFLKNKELLSDCRGKLSQIDQEYGEISGNIKKIDGELVKLTTVLEEVKQVQGYVAELEDIQNNVYNRDGSVGKSLRSWSLEVISQKASDYLEKLNTKIQRISLSEKTRDVNITCYSRNTTLEIESLSGGEQVSIALSLRLGMAHLLGSSNLNFMILDEPTTHLDSERRKSLVEVLSQLANIRGEENSMQFIIISHDAEIFEDSSVENIYKFESSINGTIVKLL